MLRTGLKYQQVILKIVKFMRILNLFLEMIKISDYVVGHSAGGSATLELEKNYPDRKITSVTYNSPIFETVDPNKILNPRYARPLRFAIAGDPVSMFDMNAQTTYMAPVLDPTLGLHSMKNNYSNPSTNTDF